MKPRMKWHLSRRARPQRSRRPPLPHRRRSPLPRSHGGSARSLHGPTKLTRRSAARRRSEGCAGENDGSARFARRRIVGERARSFPARHMVVQDRIDKSELIDGERRSNLCMSSVQSHDGTSSVLGSRLDVTTSVSASWAWEPQKPSSASILR
jgi:hypothetical protein